MPTIAHSGHYRCPKVVNKVCTAVSEEEPLANLHKSLRKLMRTDGTVGAALVDAGDGMTLATAGGAPDLDLEAAGAGIVDVVRTKRRVLKQLASDDEIEDILIVLGQRCHLIRPLAKNARLALYLVLDRERGNLGMARFRLQQIEADLSI